MSLDMDIINAAMVRDNSGAEGAARRAANAANAKKTELNQEDFLTLMLTQLLRSEGYTADYFTDLPEQELVAFINEVKPEAVFVSCANLDHLDQGHSLLQLLAANFPDLGIVAGGSAFSQDRARTLAAGATYVPSTLKEAKDDFIAQRKGARKKSARMTFSGTRFRVPPPA